MDHESRYFTPSLENAMVFELDHERYGQLITELRDPRAVVRMVWSATSCHGAVGTS